MRTHSGGREFHDKVFGGGGEILAVDPRLWLADTASPMERFARTIIGYHGCTRAFAEDVLLGRTPIDQWQPSQNVWDWLGHGIYFWEHSPGRALRWAQEHYADAAVLGAM